MSSDQKISWQTLVAFAIATVISTILALFAVIVAPIAPFPGVSGLYLAAAVYVPLSLWLGLWGCLAGYISCVILGYSIGLGLWSFVWALADFVEALIPLLAYRLFKEDVDIGDGLEDSQKQKLYLILLLLIVNLIIAAFATSMVIPALWVGTLIIAIILMVSMYLVTKSRKMLIFIVFGIIGASICSALIGIGVLVLAGFAPPESFGVGVLGWFAGDLIVLSAIATPMMVFFTARIKESPAYVEGWL